MTAQDDRFSSKMQAGYPGGDREPTLDVPPLSQPGAGTAPAPADAADAMSDPAPRAEAPATDELAALRAELEKAKTEVAEYKDRALRAVADFENFRRRAEKEREDVSRYAISNFAREMLPVADNLRRALDSQPVVDGETTAALKAFVSGVELTERELLAAFERFGLKKIEPTGQPFDHNLHQAMFEIEDANLPTGTVLQVMQAGYVLKDRLLRPAMVGVSKGGPTEARPAANTAARDAYGAAAGGGDHTFDTKA